MTQFLKFFYYSHNCFTLLLVLNNISIDYNWKIRPHLRLGSVFQITLNG
jgi:hypothetical protein